MRFFLWRGSGVIVACGPSCPMAILQCVDSRFVILNAVGGVSAKLISERVNDI
jgi:hypothetical protein